MIKFSATSFAALTAAFLSGPILPPAHAADVFGKGSAKDSIELTRDAERSWTGVWLGAVGGYGISNTELSLDHFHDNGETVNGTNLGKLDGLGGEGLFGEVQLGYDRQLGRFVAGCFGGAGLSGSETTISVGDEGSAKIEEDTSYLLGCRLGALLNKSTMVYVAGGWRWQDADLTLTSGDESEKVAVDFDGAFGEIGLESHIAGGLYGRVAGRYTAFQDRTWSNRSAELERCWEELNADPGKLEIMAGVTYKFGLGF